MKKSFFKIILFLLILCNTTNGDAAVFSNTYGISAEGIGKGNAMCASSNDWSAVYYNPAGLGKTRHLKSSGSSIRLTDPENGSQDKNKYIANQIAFSYFYTHPMLKIDINRSEDSESGGDNLSTNADKDLNFDLIIIGGAFDLKKILDPNLLFGLSSNFVSSFRFGICVATGLDTMMTINHTAPETHNYMLYGREARAMKIQSGIGIGFFDDTFGIGISFSTGMKNEGKMLVEDVEISDGQQTPASQTKMDTRPDTTLNAGLYYQVTSQFIIGASYMQESAFEMEIETNARTSSGISQSMLMTLVEFYVPETYCVGIAVTFASVTISLDLEYQRWSNFKLSQNDTDNIDENVSEHGEDYVFHGFEDIIIPRLGISIDVLESTSFLLGYYYRPTMIPDETVKGRYNYMDSNQHVVSGGIKYTIAPGRGMGGPVTFILSSQLQLMEERSVTKNNPDTYNPDYSYGGMVPSVIVEVGMNF